VVFDVELASAGREPTETHRGLPGDPDDTHSRYIEAAIGGVVVGCLYLPNGNPAPGPKFDYKLVKEHGAGTGSSLTHHWREMDSNFRFRASGDTPHRPRGEAASHRSRLPLRRDPPSGRDLDDGTVSQLLEELAGEMNRPSDRKRRISGYGDRTWRRN
jgi:hypothetical protein